jgi:hypothetical protein
MLAEVVVAAQAALRALEVQVAVERGQILLHPVRLAPQIRAAVAAAALTVALTLTDTRAVLV